MELPIICRACLTEITDEYIPMNSEWNNTTVLDIFNYCTKLKATLDDEFSTSLCIACGTSLQTAYEFLKTTYETDKILRSSVGYSYEESEEKGCKIEKVDIDFEGQYQEEYIEENGNTEIKDEIIEDAPTPNEQIDGEFIEEAGSFQSDFHLIDESELPEQRIHTNQENVEDSNKDIKHIFDQKQNKRKGTKKKPPNKAKRLYKCDSCEQIFKNMFTRNKHEFIDHQDPQQPRKCKLCNFSTASLNSWQTHRYRHEHPTQKKYLCSFCPKKFPNPKSLLMHEDYQHGNKEIAAKCDKCGKKFMNKQKLEYHILSRHSNGRNFQCPECPKTFKNSFQLRAHKKLHSERTINCPECDKKFARQVDLRVHMRIHTGELPYQCELCDKRYRIKVRLTYHMQKHLGTKHVCELCSSEFNSKPKLRLHMFEHIGMPYVCDECQMGFNNRSGLSRHTKAVHNYIMTDEELLQNRLNNEANVKRGTVSETDLIVYSKELEI